MLKRQYRLKDRRDFTRVYRRGRILRSSNFAIYHLSNRAGHNRLAVVVSTKVSRRATTRNRIRRRLQGLTWEEWPNLQNSYDILISVKNDVSKLPAGQLKAELLESFKRARLL